MGRFFGRQLICRGFANSFSKHFLRTFFCRQIFFYVLWTVFAKIFCEQSFVDSFCGQFFYQQLAGFEVNFCNQLFS